jgi:hypothetical protein
MRLLELRLVIGDEKTLLFLIRFELNQELIIQGDEDGDCSPCMINLTVRYATSTSRV